MDSATLRTKKVGQIKSAPRRNICFMVRKNHKVEEKRANGRQVISSAGTLERDRPWPDDLFTEESSQMVTSVGDVDSEHLTVDDDETSPVTTTKASNRSADDALG